jgi:hypothetical protein
VSGRGDEALRSLERQVAATGDRSVRLKLASELDRRGRPRDATQILLDAVRAFPKDRDVRLALGKFRGPAPGPWGAVRADARNTRLSPAKGPRGEGQVISREPIAAFEGYREAPAPPPLVAQNLARPIYSLGVNRTNLAVTADGHVISQSWGEGGFEFSAEREGHRAWRFHFEHAPDEDQSRWSRSAHAAIAPDGTVFGLVRSGKLIAVEPTGEARWIQELPARATSLALDAEHERLYVAYEAPSHLVALDTATGRELWSTNTEMIVVPSEVIVLGDGRVACVSPMGWVAIIAPDGGLQLEIRYAERIWDGIGAVAPWGELVIVSSDKKGAYVWLFDPGSKDPRGRFEAPECFGVPAIDSAGTIYFDGGARGYVLGFDLAGGAVRYKLDRPTFWQPPERPGSAIALGDGEVVFMDFAESGVALVRGGARE